MKVLVAIPAFFAVLFFFTAGSVNNLAAQDTQPNGKPPETQKTVTQEKPITGEPIYQVVETMSSFPGGDDAMIKFISENI